MKHSVRNGVRFVLLAILWPILRWQARHVYRVTPQLPEASGLRSGYRGQLVKILGDHYAVEWELLALFSTLQARPYDVVVLSIGANDATRLCTPRNWACCQGQLASLIDQKFNPGLLVHTAVPPMHSCQALPQPLRWFMGLWAGEMNRLLSKLCAAAVHRTMLRHPDSTTTSGMSVDGIHPSALGYQVWAECLGRHIVTHCGL